MFSGKIAAKTQEVKTIDNSASDLYWAEMMSSASKPTNSISSICSDLKMIDHKISRSLLTKVNLLGFNFIHSVAANQSYEGVRELCDVLYTMFLKDESLRELLDDELPSILKIKTSGGLTVLDILANREDSKRPFKLLWDMLIENNLTREQFADLFKAKSKDMSSRKEVTAWCNKEVAKEIYEDLQLLDEQGKNKISLAASKQQGFIEFCKKNLCLLETDQIYHLLSSVCSTAIYDIVNNQGPEATAFFYDNVLNRLSSSQLSSILAKQISISPSETDDHTDSNVVCHIARMKTPSFTVFGAKVLSKLEPVDFFHVLQGKVGKPFMWSKVQPCIYQITNTCCFNDDFILFFDLIANRWTSQQLDDILQVSNSYGNAVYDNALELIVRAASPAVVFHLLNSDKLGESSCKKLAEFGLYRSKRLMLDHIKTLANKEDKIAVLWECLQGTNSALGLLFSYNTDCFTTPSIHDGVLKDVYIALEELSPNHAAIYKRVVSALEGAGGDDGTLCAIEKAVAQNQITELQSKDLMMLKNSSGKTLEDVVKKRPLLDSALTMFSMWTSGVVYDAVKIGMRIKESVSSSVKSGSKLN